MTKDTGSTEHERRAKPAASVGSGWIVMARDPARGRLRGGHAPYEHRTREDAHAEAARLAECQGRDFEVFGRIARVHAPERVQPIESGKRRTISLPENAKGGIRA